MDSEERARIRQCVYLLRRFAGCLAALEHPRFCCRGCGAAFSSNSVPVSIANAAARESPRRWWPCPSFCSCGLARSVRTSSPYFTGESCRSSHRHESHRLYRIHVWREMAADSPCTHPGLRGFNGDSSSLCAVCFCLPFVQLGSTEHWLATPF